MISDKLLDAIELIDDEAIADARKDRPKRKVSWKPLVAIAACICLLIGTVQFNRNNETIPAGNGGSGHDEGLEFMKYAGPIFPVTILEDSAGLEATRNILYDFTAADTGMSCNVTDSYSISNSSETDRTVTAAYPFTGDFQTASWPLVTADGVSTDYGLHSGIYSGSFRGAGSSEGSLNLQEITSWTGYEELLSDGSYMADAFADAPILSQPVTVYKFTEIYGSQEGYPAATLCMHYTADLERSTILTYGFNGGSIKESGECSRSFFIPEESHVGYDSARYLLVIGEDISEYGIQGYEDGGCNPGTEIENAGAQLTRYETTLGEVLLEITQLHFDTVLEVEYTGDRGSYINERIDLFMYFEQVCKYFMLYSPLGTSPQERYSMGMLDEILSETVYHDRIFWLTFRVKIPAGDKINLDISFQKNGSYDFGCEDTANKGVEGYDLVTALGSSLQFSSITASLRCSAGLKIVRQNMGFDLEKDLVTVALDPNEKHYYLEIRR